jgi:hypothetical protein
MSDGEFTWQQYPKNTWDHNQIALLPEKGGWTLKAYNEYDLSVVILGDAMPWEEVKKLRDALTAILDAK